MARRPTEIVELGHTDGVRANGICVDTEEGYRDERAVPAQPQNCVSEFYRSVVLVCVTLVEVDVCTLSSALHEK